MFILQAVGDSYGAAFEFLNFERYHPNDGQNFYIQPDTRLGGGRYTDDTQMNLALFAAIEKYGRGVNALNIADSFVEYWKCDPRPGYSMGFKNLLDTCSDGADLLAKINPNSTRCGAIMRAPSAGIYTRVEDVLRVSRIQAEITHNTEKAIEASQAISLAMHYVLHRQGPKSELRDFIIANLNVPIFDWSLPRREWATIEAYDCAANALTAFIDSETVYEVLINSIAWGGDTDSVAAAAMCLAWAEKSMKLDLPSTMYDNLEHGLYGFQHLLDRSSIFSSLIHRY